MTPPERLHVSRLIGVPYWLADCWEIVVLALADAGVEWPVDPALVLARPGVYARELRSSEPTRVGDVLVMPGAMEHGRADPSMGGRHVAIVVDAEHALHSASPSTGTGHAGLVKLAVLDRAAVISARWRPVAWDTDRTREPLA
jgi:hypothetical protein